MVSNYKVGHIFNMLTRRRVKAIFLSLFTLLRSFLLFTCGSNFFFIFARVSFIYLCLLAFEIHSLTFADACDRA